MIIGAAVIVVGLLWYYFWPAKGPDGTAQRPDFVIIDDVQTDKSAISPHQVRGLITIIKKSILKLSGHGRKLACIVNATVLAADDVIEYLLDPVRSKSWQGERIKMVRKWPDANDTLWLGTAEDFEGECYATIRNTFNRDDPDDQRRAHDEATAFYLSNREAMDAGGDFSWEGCFDPECEVSAAQHAYNFLIDDGPDVFATECQVEPPKPTGPEEFRATAKDIAGNLNGFARFAIPSDCQYLTAFTDVQDSLLYYAVCAWEMDFTGYVISYGTWPEQGRDYFRLSDARRTLATVFPGEAQESLWYQGLTKLTENLVTHKWERDGDSGTAMHLDKLLVDANYGNSTATVKRFCSVSEHSRVLLPTHGRGISAADAPMDRYTEKPGERLGMNWLIRPDGKAKGLKHATYDVHWWKSFIQNRFKLKAAVPGSLTLWGNDARQHEMFADHIVSEKPIVTTGKGRTVTEWRLPPNKPDNHFLDCIVGCAVAASMLGVSLEQHRAKPKRKRKRFNVTF